MISGWSANQNVHWIVSVLGITIYALTVYIISQCLFVYIPMSYPQYAASLFAGNDLCRSAFAFAAVLFARPMFLKLGIGKGVSLLAGLSVLGIVSGAPGCSVLQTTDPSYRRLGCGSFTSTVQSCGRDPSSRRSNAPRLLHTCVMNGNASRRSKVRKQAATEYRVFVGFCGMTCPGCRMQGDLRSLLGLKVLLRTS